MEDEDYNLQQSISRLKFALERASNQVLVDELGWGASHFRLLLTIAHSPRADQTTIAKELGQTNAAVSRQVKLLIDEGLVVQAINPDDRRQNELNITSKGHQKLLEAKACMKRSFKQLFANLEPATVKHAVRLINEITLAIEQNNESRSKNEE